MAVNAANAPAMAQAIVEVRVACTPASRAASVFAADARRASPKRLRLRNQASPATTIGVPNSIAK